MTDDLEFGNNISTVKAKKVVVVGSLSQVGFVSESLADLEIAPEKIIELFGGRAAVQAL